MEDLMPFRTYKKWLFDGRINTPIPKPKVSDNGKIITPDILKYNSPISNPFMISMFLRHGPLNLYLNKVFNNYHIFSVDREDMMKFMKQCVIDFRLHYNHVVYYPRKPKNLLFDKLREKLPMLKDNDIELLCDIIEKSDYKENVYTTLNLKMPKKRKYKKTKMSRSRNKKVEADKFVKKYFSIERLK